MKVQQMKSDKSELYTCYETDISDFFLDHIFCSLFCSSSSLLLVTLSPGHIYYCRDHFANSLCDRGCDFAPCGWDSSECSEHQSPAWAKGTLMLHIRTPPQRGASNSSVLWALSVLLLSPLKLRGSVPLATSRNLFDFNHQELADMLAQTSPADSDGWVLVTFDLYFKTHFSRETSSSVFKCLG